MPACPDGSLLEALLQQLLAEALLRRYGIERGAAGSSGNVSAGSASEAAAGAGCNPAASEADDLLVPGANGMGPLVPADGVGAPPELAGLLAIVDPDALDDTQTMDFLKAAARVEAWVQSCQVKALHRFALLRPGTGADRDPEGFSRYAPQEISAHLSTGEAAARALLADAKQIGAHLPGTLQAMSSGELDLPRAKALARGSADLPADCLPNFENAVLPGAGDITLDSVRARARRTRDRLHPESLAERHRQANESRDVQVTEQDDGMAELWIRTSADKAHLVFDRIQSAARSLQGPAESRTLPQLRADVFSDLLLSGAPALAVTTDTPAARAGAPDLPAAPTSGSVGEPAVGGTGGPSPALGPKPGPPRGGMGPGMLVTMPLTTLLGLSEESGDLAGHGRIPADMGRQLAQLATSWLLVLTDEHGQAIAAARKLRIPPAWLKRLIRVRDRHCRFPGCRRAAQYCEIDHVIAWEDGGLTVPENLQCLCKVHHAAKTAGHIQAEAGPNGAIAWTTRTGHRKTTHPDEGWDTLLPHPAAGRGMAKPAPNGGTGGSGASPKRTLGGIELPEDDTDPDSPPSF
ncbi:MAG TPA: DUF222 domain-containing protein [Arthrobacter sp.]|nr:DUF222 domain-containing protein [Arthrobacter sp.]